MRFWDCQRVSRSVGFGKLSLPDEEVVSVDSPVAVGVALRRLSVVGFTEARLPVRQVDDVDGTAVVEVGVVDRLR